MPTMAIKNSDWHRTKQIEVDGIGYDISVRQFGDGYYRAAWRCCDCSEDGAWAPVSASPEQSIALAKIALHVHHSLIHGPVPRRPK